MSKQQEDFKKLAFETSKKAEGYTGPYRDVLLSVAEAYAALAFHQGIVDGWGEFSPAPPPARGHVAPETATQTIVGTHANQNGTPRSSAA